MKFLVWTVEWKAGPLIKINWKKQVGGQREYGDYILEVYLILWAWILAGN